MGDGKLRRRQGRRVARGVLAVALTAVITGCAVNAGSVGAARVTSTLEHDARVLNVTAQGSNDLPFFGSVQATVITRTEIEQADLIDYAEELTSFDAGRGVSVSVTLSVDGVELRPGLLATAPDAAAEVLSDPRVSGGELQSGADGTLGAIVLEARTLADALGMYVDHAANADVTVRTALGSVLLEDADPRAVTELAETLPALAELTDIVHFEMRGDAVTLTITEDAAISAVEDELRRGVPSLAQDEVTIVAERIIERQGTVGLERALEGLSVGEEVTSALSAPTRTWLAVPTPAAVPALARELHESGFGLNTAAGFGIVTGSPTDPGALRVSGWKVESLPERAAVATAILRVPSVTRVDADRLGTARVLDIDLAGDASLDTADRLVPLVHEASKPLDIIIVRVSGEPVLSFTVGSDTAFVPLPGESDGRFRERWADLWPG